MEETWRAIQAAFETAALTASRLNAGGVTIVVICESKEGMLFAVRDLNCPDGSFRMARRQALEQVIRESVTSMMSPRRIIMSMMAPGWNIAVKSDNGGESGDKEVEKEAKDAFYGELIGLE